MAQTNWYSWSPALKGGQQPGGASPENSPLPLSDAQLGIWFAQALDPSSPAYNLGEYLDIGGTIDAALFETALRQVVNETEALCVRFVATADGPRQIIGPAPDWSMSYIDVSAAADPQAAADRWMKADLAKPIDVTQGPLFAYALFKAAPDRFFWYSRYHHIVMDGVGLALVARRVADVYTALAAGRTADTGHLRLARSVARRRCGISRFQAVRAGSSILDGLPRRPAGAGKPGRACAAEILRLHSTHRLGAVFDHRASAVDRAAHRGEPAATRHRRGGNFRASSDRRTGRHSRCSADGTHDAACATHSGHDVERLAGATDRASEHDGIRAGRRNRAADAQCDSTPALQRREFTARYRTGCRPESIRSDGQFHAVRLRLAFRWSSRHGPQPVGRSGRRSVHRFV